VKNRLKASKDKLLRESFKWILQDPVYLNWRDGHDVGLLWIRGGAGKGKTMMSIGLIEELAQKPKAANLVTYFFCQNADQTLDTVEAIIKGLILQLVKQQRSLQICLREKWDAVNERFEKDLKSWEALWEVFLDMLDRCDCPRVYIVVDALDECHKEDMEGLLRSLVRTGLSYPARIKWLLTSRPLDIAQQRLLTGTDQVLVSLELNSGNVSYGVEVYITHRVDELDRLWSPDPFPRQEIESELHRKAEGTFLWVNLVCQKLEDVSAEKALTTIRSFQPGLDNVYCRAIDELFVGKQSIVEGCIRLLKVMKLTFRPLNLHEVGHVAGLRDDKRYIQTLIDRCASFVQNRGPYVEFQHQTALEFLDVGSGSSLLESRDPFDSGDIAMNCLTHLSNRLKVNILNCPHPGATREAMLENPQEREENVLTSLGYAAVFWAQHLDLAKDTRIVQDALADNGVVRRFLDTLVLEWLEYLSLLNQLPRAVDALKTLANLSTETAKVSRTSTCAIFGF